MSLGAGPVAAMLADGKRLHLNHGPIDLVICADGKADEIEQAYQQAVRAFRTVLDDLVSELELLRTPVGKSATALQGAVARQMFAAAAKYSSKFVTPMVAVAGSVADHILRSMLEGRSLQRAYVNNGGDIALHLASGQQFRIAICSNPDTCEAGGGMAVIRASDNIGGVATSGWRGRSHSFGIADAVTVLARDAASADAAATMIANEVTLEKSNAVKRRPANELSPDSDLAERLVTVEVARLSTIEIEEALEKGMREAQSQVERGLVGAVFIALQGKINMTGEATRMALFSPEMRSSPRETEIANV